MDKLTRRVFDAIEPALANAGFLILDGDDDSIIIRDKESDTDMQVKVTGIAS